MKKIFFAAAAILALFAAQSAFAIGVKVNGTGVRFGPGDGQPFAENGRTLVPLRAACEAYGAYVGYNADTQTAVVAKDNVTVLVPIGDDKIYRNEEPVTNEVAARAMDGRIYLPIRVVMEALGAQVGWDSTSQTVTVDDPDFQLIKDIESRAGGNNVTNKAIALGNEGKSLALAGKFHEAALSYERSAYYWDQVAGQSETARHFRNLAQSADTDVRLYLKTNDPAYDRTKFFNAPNEPRNGILLGSTYNTGISELTGVEHGLELQYFNYGEEFSDIGSWYYEPARKNGTVLEIALQPQNGMDEVVEDEYLIRQAQFLESTGCKILLRFANEMNDVTCPWYTADYNKYIEKFRLVSRVFKTYAPSVAMVWAPNFYPSDTIDLYYPGDEYVDYVGLSTYQEYNPDNDPLGQGIERGRWTDILDQVYETYGSRKPIIISEGGCSYVSVWTKQDITDFAVKQMENFYTYLPIKYPNLKMAVLFNSEDWGGRKFKLADNFQMLDAYVKGINSSERYISHSEDTAGDEYYYELHNNFTIPAGVVELCSYISSPISDYDYVIHTIAGVDTPTYVAPYTAMFDLTPYAGQTLDVRVRAFGGGALRAEDTFKIKIK